ncbi:MAG: DHHW family protein [Lachnospira sp.]
MNKKNNSKYRIKDSVDKNSERYRRYMMKKASIYKIVLFLAAIVIGAVISLIIPIRPTESEVEKRTLSRFPSFSVDEFLSGAYFEQIDTWFADTFPARDVLMGCNDKLTNMYGFRTTVINGEVVPGDDIPDVEFDENEFDYLLGIGEGQTPGNPGDGSGNTGGNTTDNSSVDKPYDGDSQIDDIVVDSSDIGTDVDSTDGSQAANKGEQFGSLFIVGDSGYEYYSFVLNLADSYAEAINSAAKAVEGKAKVYDMLVPTSIDITLDDATRNSISSSNQKKAILYMFSKMNGNVGKSYIYDLMRSHRDEYIYFRTDHHWTALGAYYAYTAFMAQTGKTAVSLDKFETVDCGDFTGSFYTQSKVSALADNPDKLTAYRPFSNNRLKFLTRQGQWQDYNIVTDTSSFQLYNKYSAFIGGDNPFTIVTNPNLTDGSNILVVKESFGNAMIPYLSESYQNVYVMDYRYYNKTVSETVDEYGIDTVLFVNNVVATTAVERIDELQKICK